jgi:integrase
VNFRTGTASLDVAKVLARQHLEQAAQKTTLPCYRTLADVVEFYRVMPKRAGQKAEDLNVMWLKCIVREAWGRDLKDVRIDAIGPKLWREFMTKRQGGKLDLAKRRLGNASINTAVRCAASIFIKRLRPLYKEEGIIIPEDACDIHWLPVVRRPPAELDQSEILETIQSLATNPRTLPDWRTLATARFAGLRRSEIMALRGGWYAEHRGKPVVELRDRPEEDFLTKTGRSYRATILDPELARQLKATPKDELFVLPVWESRERWFAFEPQKWLKPFMPSVQKPLQRLRGLYADHLAELTEDAITARLAGVKEASKALGHTTTTTTSNHYLSDDAN